MLGSRCPLASRTIIGASTQKLPNPPGNQLAGVVGNSKRKYYRGLMEGLFARIPY